MLIFSPKLFFILALALASGYLLLSPSKPAPRGVDQKAVSWVMTRLDASTATLPAPDGALESLRAENDARMNALPMDLRPPQPPQPQAPRTVEELTVAALIRALEAALRSVPDAIPHLPLMPGMVHAVMRQDPQAIAFGPVPPNAWAYFTPRDPYTGRPRIVMSEDLKRLHSRGVPTPLLADVLVHELDHMMLHFLGKRQGMKRNDVEESAFRSEGYFLSAMMPNKGHGGDGAAVDATGDAEKDAYLAELKKIRLKMFNGELPQMIRESYGPDPSETASGSSSGSGSQRHR